VNKQSCFFYISYDYDEIMKFDIISLKLFIKQQCLPLETGDGQV